MPDAPPVADRPLFFLDYDGTLAPIVDDPDAATPHPDAPALLKKLDAQYPLWIVTGRDLQALERLLGLELKGIGLHGAQEGVIGRRVERRMTDAAAQAMQRLRRTLPSMEGVEVEDKDPAFAVHYRQARDAGEAQDRLKAWLETLPDMLDAVWGKKVVELRPQGLTKGTAVRRIAADHPERTPVYLGDDTTDEDAFEALDAMADDDTPAPVTVKIGPEDEPTAARYRLPDPDAVVAHLQRYVEA